MGSSFGLGTVCSLFNSRNERDSLEDVDGLLLKRLLCSLRQKQSLGSEPLTRVRDHVSARAPFLCAAAQTDLTDSFREAFWTGTSMSNGAQSYLAESGSVSGDSTSITGF